MDYYGGPTRTAPPRPDSPAIDAGAPSALVTDQRGISRPKDGDRDGSSDSDLGAVERGPIYVVDTPVDENDGVTVGGISLRDAVDDASDPDENVILFDPAFLDGQTITLISGQLDMDEALVVDALDLPNGVAVSGDVTGDGPTPDDSRVLETATGIPVTMRGLTISGGYAHGAGADRVGGGILNRGLLTLENVVVTGNEASFRGGGGLYLRRSPGNEGFYCRRQPIGIWGRHLPGAGRHDPFRMHAVRKLRPQPAWRCHLQRRSRPLLAVEQHDFRK